MRLWRGGAGFSEAKDARPSGTSRHVPGSEPLPIVAIRGLVCVCRVYAVFFAKLTTKRRGIVSRSRAFAWRPVRAASLPIRTTPRMR